MSLYQAVRVNVTGPLLLLKLAEECKNFLCLTQISTCFANCDKSGVIEEKLLDSPVDWNNVYSQVQTMNKLDLEHYQRKMLGPFPNTFIFSKRMAEHMLCS